VCGVGVWGGRAGAVVRRWDARGGGFRPRESGKNDKGGLFAGRPRRGEAVGRRWDGSLRTDAALCWGSVLGGVGARCVAALSAPLSTAGSSQIGRRHARMFTLPRRPPRHFAPVAAHRLTHAGWARAAQLCSEFTCDAGDRIDDAATTTGNTTEVCCARTGFCTGNTGAVGDVTCTSVGGSLVAAAETLLGSTEDECCVVSGACVGNTDATAEPDAECFHVGTQLYDPPRMGRSETACCEAGNATLAFSLFLVLIAMYVIAYACDSFEPAADYLGTEVYMMGPGIRGASIEAIASSLPELFTTLFLLFAHNDQDGFSAGVATCAGSALFNGAIIPAICIFAVTVRGVDGEKVEKVELSRAVLLRDGAFFLTAEVLLIVFLNSTTLTWWMGMALMIVYFIYAFILIQGVGVEDDDGDEEADSGDADADPEDDDKGGDRDLELADRVQGGDDEADDDGTGVIKNPMKQDDSKPKSEAEGDDDDDGPDNAFQACITFDTNYLFFGGNDYTPGSAWGNVFACTVIIALACYVLAESVILSARALGVAPYFTAVILGAAASSVPDTIISYKDALKGDYDDAVANAIGSNIFDICFALGLPLFLYGLIHGDVTLTAAGSVSSGDGSASEIQSLRVMLVICSLVMLSIFLFTKTGQDDKGRPVHYVNYIQATLLTLLYVTWTTIIILQAAGVIVF
jgi:Ca2+/Na+ antiporter